METGMRANSRETAATAGFLVVRHIQHRGNGLFLGRLNEGARVDNQNIGFRRVIGQLNAVVLEFPQHDFRIHQILGTAKTDKTCFHKKTSCKYTL